MTSMFDALPSATPASPAAPPPPASGSMFDSLPGETPPAGKPAAKSNVADDLIGGTADAIDLIWGGLFAAPVAMAGEGITRAQLGVNNALGLGEPRTRREIGEAGQATAARLNKNLGQPVRNTLQALGLLSDRPMAIEKAMTAAMSLVERDAQAVEERTGGRIQKQDVLMGVNTLFGALGAKGVQYVAKTVPERAKAKEAIKELAAIREQTNAANAVADAEALNREAGGIPREARAQDNPAVTDANLAAFDQRVNAEARAYELMQSGAPKAKVEAIIKKNPAVGKALDAMMARRAQAATFLQEAPLQPIREDGTFAENAKTSLLHRPSEMGAAEMQARDAAAGIRRGALGEPILTDSPRPPPVSKSSRDPSRRPVDQRLPGRGPLGEEITQPVKRDSLGTPLSPRNLLELAGATGLGLAAYYAGEGEPSDVAAAAAGGAFVLGKGRGITLDAIRALPDTATLREIRDASAYTLNTLENLPGNRAVHAKQAVSELLRRQEVTKAERDILQSVLDSVPGETITAKQLMAGVKEATGDFELTPKQSDSFATYGLESIDRRIADEWIPDDLPVAETARLEAEAAAAKAELGATTTIYQSPFQLGTNNHFRDPNYFAHTRSFYENGVKHVVEMQSDLAQKAGKVLTPEERAKLQENKAWLDRISLLAEEAHSAANDVRSTNEDVVSKAKAYFAGLEDIAFDRKLTIGQRIWDDYELGPLRNEIEAADPGGRSGHNGNYDVVVDRLIEEVEKAGPEMSRATQALESGLWNEARDYNLLRRETEAKLAESGPLEKVFPMLKRWDRRLVREELAESARKGEPTARFATADTVAKVEGWPEGNFGDGSQRFRPEHQGIYDRYNKEVTSFLRQLGGKEVTDSAGHTWIEVPTEGTRKLPAGKRVQQFGAADPELVKTLGAIGGGVAVASLLSDDENKARNMALAAVGVGLAMFGRSHARGLGDYASSVVAGAERYLGTVSTRVGDISPRLLRRMREHERGVLTRTNAYLQAISPFIEGLRKVPEAMRAQLDAAILTGDQGKITAALGRVGKPELVAQFRQARQLLNTVGAELMQAGKLKGLLPDYYPRIVTDVPGLLKALGQQERTHIEKLIADATKKTMREALRDLTPFEISQIINKGLKSAPRGGRPGFLKQRAVEEVTPELAKFYAPASESLPLYLRAVSKELERARFFGENLLRDPVTGATNLDESIGNLVREEQASGRVTPEQAMELGSILQSRFGPGERATSRPLQAAKNLAYAGLLGHVTSAITQLGDVAIAAAAHGIVPTLKAIQQNVTRKPARATVHDLGMIDHMAEEIVGASRSPVTVFGRQISTAKFLDKVFKFSGFSWVDSVGKNVSIQASKNKLESWARTPAGIKRLEAKYGKAYSPAEMQQLVADLRSGELTELVKGVMFSELSDVQPISKLEVPQAYLDNPNGRVLYMLKTFMLKQADIVRRNVVKEVRAGNYRKATENGLRFGLALGIGGATTQWINDWLLGREREASAADIPLNALKTFGWSQYTLDKVKQGKPLEAATDVIAPPYKMFDTIISQDPAAIQYLPIIGRLYYARDWLDLLDKSGSDKANERYERELRRKEREE